MHAETTSTRGTALGAELTTARGAFRTLYSQARSLRGVLVDEFVSVGDVEAFLTSTRRVVVGRRGDYVAKPGFYAACINGAGTKSGRRYFLELSRGCDRVPLPR